MVDGIPFTISISIPDLKKKTWFINYAGTLQTLIIRYLFGTPLIQQPRVYQSRVDMIVGCGNHL